MMVNLTLPKSQKFLFLPTHLRTGVLVLSLLVSLSGGWIACVSWRAVLEHGNTFNNGQKAGIITTGLLFTILTLVCLAGSTSIYTYRLPSITLYHRTLKWLLGFELGFGAFVIFILGLIFAAESESESKGRASGCIRVDGDCPKTKDINTGVLVFYVGMWVVQAYLCLLLPLYIEQLQLEGEDEETGINRLPLNSFKNTSSDSLDFNSPRLSYSNHRATPSQELLIQTATAGSASAIP